MLIWRRLALCGIGNVRIVVPPIVASRVISNDTVSPLGPGDESVSLGLGTSWLVVVVVTVVVVAEVVELESEVEIVVAVVLDSVV